MGTQENSHDEMVLMCAQNICFYGEKKNNSNIFWLKKILSKASELVSFKFLPHKKIDTD